MKWKEDILHLHIIVQKISKTIMKKQLPKAAIYKKFNLNSSAKARFDSDISRMDIVGEISQSTVSLPAGDSVSSIFVLQISLKKPILGRWAQWL